jgi:transposase
MQMFRDVSTVYLHREPVDFRKSINGLTLIIESDLLYSPFSGTLYVFCNRKRDKLKIVYWDRSGFALWYKRLEEDKFRWPKRWPESLIELTETQLHRLLQGYDFMPVEGHKTLHYSSVL